MTGFPFTVAKGSDRLGLGRSGRLVSGRPARRRTKMKISLKARNVPKLLGVWVINVAIFSGVASGALDIRDLDAMRVMAAKMAQDPWAGWPYAALLTVVSIFNGVVSRPREGTVGVLEKSSTRLPRVQPFHVQGLDDRSKGDRREVRATTDQTGRAECAMGKMAERVRGRRAGSACVWAVPFWT